MLSTPHVFCLICIVCFVHLKDINFWKCWNNATNQNAPFPIQTCPASGPQTAFGPTPYTRIITLFGHSTSCPSGCLTRTTSAKAAASITVRAAFKTLVGHLANYIYIHVKPSTHTQPHTQHAPIIAIHVRQCFQGVMFHIVKALIS